MKSLLLVAHGSRRQASNDEVRALAQVMARRVNDTFDEVACAFLELAEPSIPDGIQQCIDRGAEEVVVVPYFLSAGRHVAEDIPCEVRGKQAEHPDVLIRTSPYLGLAEQIPDLLLKIATKSWSG